MSQPTQISWNTEKSTEAVNRFIEENGRLPVAREMNRGSDLPSRRTFERTLHMSFYEYSKKYYPKLVLQGAERHQQSVVQYRKELPNWTMERLLEAEKAFVLQHGRLPEPKEYQPEHGLPSYTLFCRMAETMLREKLECLFQNEFAFGETPKEQSSSSNFDGIKPM